MVESDRPGDVEGLDSVLTRVRRRGWRMTAQRRAVATALEGDHVHRTAEEVLTLAREALPEVSLATVYNTLNELVAMGEVTEVRHAPGPVRYDPNGHQSPHHHLYCTCCGRLLDIDPDVVGTVELPVVERHGFAVDGVEVVFRGRCAECVAGATSRPTIHHQQPPNEEKDRRV